MGLGEVPLLNFLPVAPRLSGLMEVKETDNPGGQLVLAGDPRQLGPVLRSPLTQKHGLGYSLLERLLTYNALYKKGSNGYNPQFITKLLRNYRYPRPLTAPAGLCLHLLCAAPARGSILQSCCSEAVGCGKPMISIPAPSLLLVGSDLASGFTPEQMYWGIGFPAVRGEIRKIGTVCFFINLIVIQIKELCLL